MRSNFSSTSSLTHPKISPFLLIAFDDMAALCTKLIQTRPFSQSELSQAQVDRQRKPSGSALASSPLL